MAPLSASEVIPLFQPSDSDWVVTLVVKTGDVISRRVAPGRVSEEAAVRAAMCASMIDMCNLETYSIRRAEDRSLTIETNGDSFLEMLRRKRK